MALVIEGEEKIAAPIDVVWKALNDPAVLKQSIPGCESLEMSSPTEMAAKVVLKIGPIKATFTGEVTLKNLKPPYSYTIEGEGKGGIAGFAKGGADVTLTEDGPGSTILKYEAKADVGGKIAQLGSRLITSTSKKLAGQFFSTFSEKVGSIVFLPLQEKVPKGCMTGAGRNPSAPVSGRWRSRPPAMSPLQAPSPETSDQAPMAR